MAHRPIPVTDQAVAQVALTVLFDRILGSEISGEPDASSVAGKVVDAAARVQFQPSTRRVVLTFDLAMSNGEEG